MTPFAEIDALIVTWKHHSVPMLLSFLSETAPNTPLHRLAAARALAQRGPLPDDALATLARALADTGSVNMEPDVIPDPYMTPPEAIRYDSVADEVLATLAKQASRALPAVCGAFFERQAHAYQLQGFLAAVGGEALLATPESTLSESIAVILKADRGPTGHASVSILSWARTEQHNPDTLLAQLVCPIGQVRARAALAIAARDEEAALPHLLVAAQDSDAEAVCGVVRALHFVIRAKTPLDHAALLTLEHLAATHTAAAEMVKVCEIFERLGRRAQHAAKALQRLTARPPLDVYDTHTTEVARAAERALRAMAAR